MDKLRFSAEITALMSVRTTLRYLSAGLTSLMSVTLSWYLEQPLHGWLLFLMEGTFNPITCARQLIVDDFRLKMSFGFPAAVMPKFIDDYRCLW
ncbi:hypothetical protein [Paenibacillus sp. MMS20-IR301]|uniref:hypothetical protein n=1 Tax=Paenibacillus sp. MMS20-IR301 TaxID=2895946 RepID=UPI0028E9A544|nr:hypothetical protein [Paenibacillus sp. MMS20-IR301]WNS45358.1 hypothetical protein LOS79_08825 [Paenibacillus sp. MMS20-IR301]